MRKLLLALALCLLPSVAFAQCAGVFPANTVCGNFGPVPAPPAATTLTTSITGPSSSTSGFIPNWIGTAGVQLGSQNTITTSQVFNFTNTISGSGANNLANTTSLFVANITSNLYYKGTLVNLLSGGGACNISASSSGYVYNAGSLGCLTSNTLVTSGGMDTETGQFLLTTVTRPGISHITSANTNIFDTFQNNGQGQLSEEQFIVTGPTYGVRLVSTGPNYIGTAGQNNQYIIGDNGLYVNGSFTPSAGFFFPTTGAISALSPITLSAFTVATLPPCAIGITGSIAFISNGAAGSTYYSTVLATGTSPSLVMCAGTVWTYH